MFCWKDVFGCCKTKMYSVRPPIHNKLLVFSTKLYGSEGVDILVLICVCYLIRVLRKSSYAISTKLYGTTRGVLFGATQRGKGSYMHFLFCRIAIFLLLSFLPKAPLKSKTSWYFLEKTDYSSFVWNSCNNISKLVHACTTVEKSGSRGEHPWKEHGPSKRLKPEADLERHFSVRSYKLIIKSNSTIDTMLLGICYKLIRFKGSTIIHAESFTHPHEHTSANSLFPTLCNLH